MTFEIQIPRTILTVQITVGPMQRMKINFLFPQGHLHTWVYLIKRFEAKGPFHFSLVQLLLLERDILKYLMLTCSYAWGFADTTLIGPQDLALK